MALEMGMFGSEFDSKSPRFGIYCGQLRGDEITHNGGWYNERGQKIGWGDLNVKDIIRITEELEDDELFIVLSESASFWNFVQKPGLIGSMAEVDGPNELMPGVQYMVEHAMYVFEKGQAYWVDAYQYRREEFVDISGRDRAGHVRMRRITQQELKEKIMMRKEKA